MVMTKCPVCGGDLIIIAGYTLPNFCRKCDKLIFTSEMLGKEEEETW